MIIMKGASALGRERQIQKNNETRKAIIDAAVSIGLEEGFDELSIRKITDRLGYSAGIVYHYFKDKQEILDIIHNQTSLELKDAVEACISPERSFEENTKVVFKMVCEMMKCNRDTFKLILVNRGSRSSESIDLWLDMVKRCIDIGIESGELRDVDSEITAHTLLNTILVAHMIISDRKTEKSKIEDIFNTELDIILHGILK